MFMKIAKVMAGDCGVRLTGLYQSKGLAHGLGTDQLRFDVEPGQHIRDRFFLDAAIQ